MEIYENQQLYSMGSQRKVGAALNFMPCGSAFGRLYVLLQSCILDEIMESREHSRAMK